MKIILSLLTVELDKLGGLNLHLSELLRGLIREGHDVSAFQTSVSAKNSEKFIQSLGDHARSIVLNAAIPRGRLFYLYLPILWRIASKIIEKEKADIFDLWDPLAYIGNQMCVNSKVIFSHGYHTHYLLEHYRNCGWRTIPMLIEIPFIEKMLNSYQKTVDGFIIESKIQEGQLLKSFQVASEAVCIIPPGYDQNIINKYRKRSYHDNSGNQKTIVFSGRIHRWKGVNELLDAFSMIASEFADWNLQFIGAGPELPKLRGKVRQRDLDARVFFTGRQNYQDTIRMVSEGNIFVSPSYIETFGLSVLEALALGIPTITTDIVGKVNNLVKNEYSSLLVPLKNVERLYSAIKRLITDMNLRQYLSKNGMQMTMGFTSEEAVKKTIAFYRR